MKPRPAKFDPLEFQFHFHFQFSDVALMDTWRQMEKLVEMGLVKDIGISNFNSAQVKEIVDNCKVGTLEK